MGEAGGQPPNPRRRSSLGRLGGSIKGCCCKAKPICFPFPVTVDELRDYFPCTLYGYKGYRLHYVGIIGFVCISPCKMGYCQHGGQCQHLPEGPTCR